MKFRKLTIENYKSFQFPTEIEFPVGGDGRSIFLIGGMNGAGKTSIMESVTYCLYGGKADDIYRNINRREKAKGNANVAFELVMEMDDGSELVVKRSWTAGAVSEPRPRDLTERLVVALEAALGIQYINRLASDILYIKQEERKGYVEISDEDLDFKQSELKREKSKLTRKHKERDDLKAELDGFKAQLEEAKRRFEAAFQVAPESREALREQEKKRVFAANRLAQVESEIRGLSEKVLPFSLAGKLFDGIRRQIEAERESASGEAIREQAATLAKRIVRVVEEPEPIFTETLSAERMAELERRICRLLQEGDPAADVVKILDLSDREAARVLNRMESLENSDVFMIKPLLDEAGGLKEQIQQIEGVTQVGVLTPTERDLFEELQGTMESCSTQIGRKTEQLRLVEGIFLGSTSAFATSRWRSRSFTRSTVSRRRRRTSSVSATTSPVS